MVTATPTRGRRGRPPATARQASKPKTATRRKPPAPENDDLIEDNSGPVVREPGTMHELFANYLNENYNAGVTPEQVAMFTSKRNEFRQTAEYLEYRQDRRNLVEEAKNKPKAAAEDKPKRPGRPRKSAAEAENTAKAPTARRGRPRKAAAEPAAEEVAPEEKSTPTRRGRKPVVKAAVKDEAVRPRRTRTTKAATKAATEPVEDTSVTVAVSEPEAAESTEATTSVARPTRRRRSSRPDAAKTATAEEPF